MISTAKLILMIRKAQMASAYLAVAQLMLGKAEKMLAHDGVVFTPVSKIALAKAIILEQDTIVLETIEEMTERIMQ